MRIDAYDATAAVAQSGVVHGMYVQQYPPGPAIDGWRDGLWARHRSRGGFDLLIAREGDDVVGLVWGYIGEHGQFWTDLAAGSLAEEVADAWLGNHFEIVELIVSPEHRRRGVGRELLTGILERSDRSRALLSVDESSIAARSLYESLGWNVLGPFGPSTSIMGLALR